MKTLAFLGLALFVAATHPVQAAEPAVPKFRAVEIDNKIEIGYGVTVADVDGDKKPDIVLADKKQFVWYKNPTWEKHVLAENLTKQDNVCIAARDIDGDGKAEIAVGAEWNPGDTVNSGAVFYLVPPKDRTQKWEAIELHHEPTVHRMRWIRGNSGKFELLVAPLHGREGAGAKILTYQMPADPHQAWKTSVVSDNLHMTHNFDPVKWSKRLGDEGVYQGDDLLLASKEGVYQLINRGSPWKSFGLAEAGTSGFAGAGEVRVGKLGGADGFVATVEPMHGNQLVVYADSQWKRYVLDTTLKEGHALACGDLLGSGNDQIVVGWRGKNDQGKVGIKIFVLIDKGANEWKQFLLDDNTMACEDLCLADLNGDGKLDVVASGRATRNVKIYYNEGTK